MEKIWAKFSGNYDSISGGIAQEAMGFLTGAPTISYNNGDPSTVNKIGSNAWNLINDAITNKYAVTTSV